MTYRRSVALLGLFCILITGGCIAGNPQTPTTTSVNTPLPAPTPTIDLAQARQAFEAGGELAYEEVIALRLEIVGDRSEIHKIKDLDKNYQAQREYAVREEKFDQQLEKCNLKESVGWVAWWESEYTSDYKKIPNRNQIAVYMYDPYSGPGKEMRQDYRTGPEDRIDQIVNSSQWIDNSK